MKPDQPEKNSAKRWPRLGYFFLLLWILLLAGLDYVYLRYLQPGSLGDSVSHVIERYLGMPAEIGKIDFVFFPEPVIVISDISLQGNGDDSFAIWIDKVRAELSWLSLFSLKPVIRSVSAENPLIYAELHARQDEQGQIDWSGLLGELIFANSLPELPRLLTGISLSVESGKLRLIQPQSGFDLLLTDFAGQLRLPGLLNGNLAFSAEQASIYLPRFPNLHIDNILLTADSIQESSQGQLTADAGFKARIQALQSISEAIGREINPVYDYFPLPEPAIFDLALNVTADPSTRNMDVKGTLNTDFKLDMNGQAVPFQLNVPFSLASLDFIYVSNMTALMENDNARITGQLTGLASGSPVLSGRLISNRFSMTRWFGFARSMSAGLQNAMNHMTGFCDFVLTGNSVMAPRIEIQHGDFIVQGSAGCPNFRDPDIYVEGHVMDADLNILFPEFNGRPTTYPQLPPPAFPVNRDHGKRVGFDLHVTADRAHIRNLSASNADCQINTLPEELRETSDEDWPTSLGSFMVAHVDDMYGGRVEATAVLREPFVIHAEISGMELEEPVRLLAGYNAFGGKTDAVIDATFEGGGPGPMLASLKTDIQANLQNGFIGSTENSRTPYNSLTIKANAASTSDPETMGRSLPPSMEFKGNWDLNLGMDEIQMRARANNAAMVFSTSNFLPISMPAQNADIQLTLNRSLMDWPRNVQLEGNGRLGFDLGKDALTLLDFSGAAGGFALSASLQATDIFGNLEVKGPISLRTNELQTSAANFNLNLPSPQNPDFMRTLLLDANFQYLRSGFNLFDLVATWDQTFLQGSLNARFGNRTLYTAALHMGTLDLDNYWPTPGTDPNWDPPLDLSFLRATDLELDLSVTQLKIFAIPLQNVHIPFSLQQGVFQAPTINANFPGAGSLSGFFTGVVKPLGSTEPHVALRLNAYLTGLDLLAMSNARGQETLLAGAGNLTADLSTAFNSNRGITRNLNGSFNLELSDGYLVGMADDANYLAQLSALNATPERGHPDLSSPRTNFRTIAASGTINNGTLHSDNFQMRNPGLNIRGIGNIDIPNMAIDASVNATLLGVPEMPMQISGSLKEPQISYNVAGAVTNTIGNLLIGIFTAPFRLFMPR